MERRETKAAKKLTEMLSPGPSESGYSQTTFAELFDMTRAAVNEWCQGKARPRPDVMRRIQDLLGIPMQDWTEPAEPEPESSEPPPAKAS